MHNHKLTKVSRFMNTLTTKHFLIGLLVLISFISLTYVSLVFYAKQEIDFIDNDIDG